MHWNRKQVALQISTDRANTWPNNQANVQKLQLQSIAFSDKSYQQYARQMAIGDATVYQKW